MAEKKPASTSTFYRPELDMLRFFAFLLVFLHHAFGGNAGSGLIHRVIESIHDIGAFGVCLFFLLSAYLITELLLKEQRKTQRVHIKAFYVRRILRIWPLYFFVICLGYVFGILGWSASITTGRLLAFLLLAGNWFSGIYGYTSNFISPLWSISVEEQYYLFWPVIARLGQKTGLFLFAAIMWIISLAVLAVLSLHHAPLNTFIWTNSFIQFQFFSLGAFAALILDGRMPSISKLRIPLLGGGFLLYFIADFCFQIRSADSASSISKTVPGYILLGGGTLFIFLGVLGVRLPELTKPVVYLGKISYGLYAYHALAILLINKIVSRYTERLAHGGIVVAPLGLLLTISLAIVSYRFFETPFLKLKERFTFIRSRTV